MKRSFLFSLFLIALQAQLLTIAGQKTDEIDLEELIVKASDETFEYSKEFKNLSAEETKIFEVFNKSGELERRRKILSDLIIYESESRKGNLGEYRNIREVDGKRIKNSDKRTVEIFKQLGKARSFEKELEKLSKESLRYDIEVNLYGFTLFQAIPLSPNFISSFKFEKIGRENIAEREAVVIKFQQTAVNPDLQFKVDAPEILEVSNAFYRGKIWIDADNHRILKLLTELTLESQRFTEPFVLFRNEYFYKPSDFGINLPARIISEMFNPQIKKSAKLLTEKGKIEIVSLIKTRVTTEYNKFSKFKVTAESK